jgi:hypothetical protein
MEKPVDYMLMGFYFKNINKTLGIEIPFTYRFITNFTYLK